MINSISYFPKPIFNFCAAGSTQTFYRGMSILGVRETVSIWLSRTYFNDTQTYVNYEGKILQSSAGSLFFLFFVF